MIKQLPPEEFFIGSEPKVPPLQRRFLYNRLIGIFAFAFALAMIIPTLQREHEPSFHLYFSKVNMEGVLVAKPVPTLLVNRPGSIGEAHLQVSQYLLVAHRKFGFPSSLAEDFDGKLVRLRGNLIFNHHQTMVEVDLKSIEMISDEAHTFNPGLELEEVGTFHLAGEIVSSKCYYGVHNPGHGKPHRACAVRCTAGGIPPVFVVREENGDRLEFLLLSREGDPMEEAELLEYVGLGVRISGDAWKWGNLMLLKTEPEEIEIL
jgi:hypothetical protein